MTHSEMGNFLLTLMHSWIGTDTEYRADSLSEVDDSSDSDVLRLVLAQTPRADLKEVDASSDLRYRDWVLLDSQSRITSEIDVSSGSVTLTVRFLNTNS